MSALPVNSGTGNEKVRAGPILQNAIEPLVI
jgi:hypothetical protein